MDYKAVGKRIKANSLQRLRWYCQMCHKQCRDENGFLNHCSSEAHVRQMQVFQDDKSHYLNEYSRLFEQGFLDTLKQRHRTERVKANHVYQQFIADRHHVHMNATRWHSLTAFIMHLGKEGKCHVEETDQGWYLTYIDRDPEKEKREEEKKRRKESDLNAEERYLRQMEEQLQFLRDHQQMEEWHATELKRAEDDVAVSFGVKHRDAQPVRKDIDVLGDAAKSLRDGTPAPSDDGQAPGKRPRHDHRQTSALDEIMAQDLALKERKNRKDYWLHPGIVVKVLNKTLRDGEFYGKKGVITELPSRYVGKVRLLDTGVVLSVDQAELETVLPHLGGKVLVVNGAHRGEVCELRAVHVDDFCADLRVAQGTHRGRELPKIAYEDFCKLFEADYKPNSEPTH